ncbi:GGDEF domain-containing protein [Agaribacter marinus]|uniref:diguanylate cyclase n=1 Tax=Agaribacter marinus TaxID=1431249 RepID=A0AA37SY46_9ALTE|nr:GGDEF domain-containing protein [Agaribacter marinus]GLR70275.1 hypothetical protein GCM10007852_11830 [Agaribacter marinus]
MYRQLDQEFRYGGEEFVIVLEQTAILDAVKLAMYLGQEVNKATWCNVDLNVTVSSGIAQFLEHESARDWISRADIALYKAKANGRNCCFADDLNSEQLIQHAKKYGVENDLNQ